MSRSFKKRPFQAICGGGSAKQDKMLARRGERRAVAQYLVIARKQESLEDFLVPHRLECSYNDVWCWGRDGNQMYQGLNVRSWGYHLDPNDTWPPQWYVQMMRK